MQLPPATQELLLLAAAEDTGDHATITTVGAQLGPRRGRSRRRRVGGPRPRERGARRLPAPLVRSALYGSAGFAERERAHAALAAVLTERDADRRAWHRAAATAGTDDHVASSSARPSGPACKAATPARPRRSSGRPT
jgi:hypothetical protein